MRKRSSPSFFSKINSHADALAMVRYVALGFYLLAGVLVILALSYQSAVWIDALVYAGLVYLLTRFNSRAVALALLIISAALFYLTFTNAMITPVQGRNAVVAFFMLIASIRAVEATFKLHGSLAEPEEA